MLDFDKWLAAGYAAILVLAVPKVSELSTLIGSGRLKLSLALLGVALVLSVFTLFFGAQVAAAGAVSDELRKSVSELTKDLNSPIDFELLRREQARGLWWPGLWSLNWSHARMLKGDWVAPGRLVAKLSQIQVYLVFAQIVLGLVASAVCAYGLI